jgi:type II secretory pathway pseudopilin PulG
MAFNEQYEKRHWLIPTSNSADYQILILFLRKGGYQAFPFMIGELISTLGYTTSIVSQRYSMEARERMFDIAFALELYRQDHGNYPALLEELAGKYITTIPVDPFTDGDSFHYVPDVSESQPNTNTNTNNTAIDQQPPKEPITGYLLYSIGLNGKDDNGIGGGYGNNEPTPKPPADNETNTETTKEPAKSGDDIRIRNEMGNVTVKP